MRLVVVVCVLCACNDLLALHPAITPREIDDTDGDGIEDSKDNCVFVPNADQHDADGDRIGDACDSCPNARPTTDNDHDDVDDACDPCLLGPNHDEDGDAIPDLCD